MAEKPSEGTSVFVRQTVTSIDDAVDSLNRRLVWCPEDQAKLSRERSSCLPRLSAVTGRLRRLQCCRSYLLLVSTGMLHSAEVRVRSIA